MLLVIKLKLFFNYSFKILVFFDISYVIYLLIVFIIYFVFMMRFVLSKTEVT